MKYIISQVKHVQRRMSINHKKAQIFAPGLVVITFVMVCVALITFFNITGKVHDSLAPPTDLLDAYNEETAFMFYAKESAAFASANAFDAIVKEISSGECTVVNLDYVLWNNNCKPDSNEINKKFLNKFNDSFSLLIKNYPSKFKNTSFASSLEGDDKIKLVSDNIVLNTSNNKGYVKYNSTFTFNPSFNLNLNDTNINLADFDTIYSITWQCKDKNMTKVEECLANRFDRWDFSFSAFDKYLLFNFNSKQSYFINDKISGIALKFALEI